MNISIQTFITTIYSQFFSNLVGEEGDDPYSLIISYRALQYYKAYVFKRCAFPCNDTCPLAPCMAGGLAK